MICGFLSIEREEGCIEKKDWQFKEKDTGVEDTKDGIKGTEHLKVEELASKEASVRFMIVSKEQHADIELAAASVTSLPL